MTTSYPSVAFVGQRWWGPGPDEFARLARASGVSASAVVLFDVEARIDRLVLHSKGGWASRLRHRRAKARLRALGADLVIVLAPHRLPADVCEIVGPGRELVAWYGDEPIGERAVAPAIERAFTRRFCVGSAWADALGAQFLPWPHLVMPDQVGTATAGARLVIIGAPYENRIDAARQLDREGISFTTIGPGWHRVSRSLTSRQNDLGALPRDRVLALLATGDYTIINIPHKQLGADLNPQFFDYAAVGCRQLYVARDIPELDLTPNLVDPERVAEDVVRLLAVPWSLACAQVSIQQSVVLRQHDVRARLRVLWG